METREEKLATWADPAINREKNIKVLTGSLFLKPNSSDVGLRTSQDKIQFDQIEHRLLGDIASDDNEVPSLWHFKIISLPRIRLGRLVLSIPKLTFQRIQKSWNLHPRTIEVFLSNNGVFTTSHSPSSGRSCLVLKVANSRSTGFDCVSVTCDPSRRTTYVLYHHLQDEDSVFATLLATPQLCLDHHFFVAALYRSHAQHLETHRNTIDSAIQGIERVTGFGNPGRLAAGRRPSLDEYPALEDPKRTLQQLSYCQTDLAIIGHVARCCLDCGDWLVRAIDERLRLEQTPYDRGESKDTSHRALRDHEFLTRLKAARLRIREDAEYTRRRTVTLVSQLQQIQDRTASQTNFMLSIITQSDAEYTAAIAVDGKRDSIAMKTLSILGIVYLPGTFVASLFSIDMFDWGHGGDPNSSSLTVAPSMWVYWAVTVPLTVLTCLIWVFWTRRENSQSAKRFTIFRTNSQGLESVAATETVHLVPGDKMV